MFVDEELERMWKEAELLLFRLWIDDRETCAQFPAGIFLSPHSVRTGSETHPASHPMRTEV
jgi:hypothetical protein